MKKVSIIAKISPKVILSLGTKLSPGDKIVPRGQRDIRGQWGTNRGQLGTNRDNRDNFVSTNVKGGKIARYIARKLSLIVSGDKIVPRDNWGQTETIRDNRRQRDIFCPRGTILSPGDNFVSRDKMTFGDILAITVNFFTDNDQRLKNYSRDDMPGDPETWLQNGRSQVDICDVVTAPLPETSHN
jgi:hypothetical protein